MIKKKSGLHLSTETLRGLRTASLQAAAGGIPTANISAENASCCSFDVCQTDTCVRRSCNGGCTFD